LSTKVDELEAALVHERLINVGPVRERLPKSRAARTFSFNIGDCEGYVTTGMYEDGRIGEVFMKVSKQGSTLAGIMDAFSIAVSLGLQHGVPLSTYVRKYANMRFEPAGITDDPDLRLATSLIDYIFRRLAVDYLPLEERAELGILTTSERTQPGHAMEMPEGIPVVDVSLGDVATASEPERELAAVGASAAATSGLITRAPQQDAPMCYQCGNTMQRAGTCYVCPSCGTTSGCS
jgi:ribonucleoside-diphosphate reductase alpha chain